LLGIRLLAPRLLYGRFRPPFHERITNKLQRIAKYDKTNSAVNRTSDRTTQNQLKL
jgi:hypothetical protein